MSDDPAGGLPPERATPVVPGQTVSLVIELDQALAGPVKVQLTARTFVERVVYDHVVVDGVTTSTPRRKAGGGLETFRDFDQLTTWEEELEARDAPPVAGSEHARALTIAWTVKVGPDARPALRPALVTYALLTDGKGGLPARIEARESVLLRASIKVTEKPSLRRVMLHELARKLAPGERDPGRPGRLWTFDEAAANRVVEGLSAAQRDLLVRYRTPTPRLVGFVTLRGPSRWLDHGADWCNFRARQPRVLANASLTLFRCAGPSEPVILACHTDHLVVNFLNAPTKSYFVRALADRLARDDATRWPRHAIGAAAPNFAFHDVFWHRIFAVRPLDGLAANDRAATDAMAGNFLHVDINTTGCWMLFRNYNWPRARYADFTGVYKDVYRPGGKSPVSTSPALASLGYPAPEGFHKFEEHDQNFAHTWFAHDVLGLRYTATSAIINDHEPHGNEPASALPASAPRGAAFDPYEELARWDRSRAHGAADDDAMRARFQRRGVEPGDEQELDRALRGETQGMNTHTTPSATSAPPLLTMPADAWRQNAFGDRAAEGFCPRSGPLTREDVERRTWADLFFVAGDDVEATPAGLRAVMDAWVARATTNER